MQFYFHITETRQKGLIVEADTEEQARQMLEADSYKVDYDFQAEFTIDIVQSKQEEGCTKQTGRLQRGERVIFTHPLPELDGRRGVVTGWSQDCVHVLWDDGEASDAWESKLDREADNPDYPLPRKGDVGE